MKDAKGHGSNKRGGSDPLSPSGVPLSHFGKPISEMGYGTNAKGEQTYGGERSSFPAHGMTIGETIRASNSARDIAEQHGIPTDHLSPGGRFGYNPKAVNDAIASSNRAGRKISGREASLIHRLLKGRG